MAGPRFYFSLRSPYSWLAYRRLLGEYRDIAEQVEWVPFWEPDEASSAMLEQRRAKFPYSAMSRAKHLYVLQDVGRLCKREGLALRWPIDRAPVWEVPHLAYLVALRHGCGPGYIAAAYRARWEQGRDICDRETVADIARELGFDPGAAAGAGDDPELRLQGAAILEQICTDGVFGVPFFVHARSRFWGLDRLDEFAAHLRERAAPAPAMPVSVGAAVGLGVGSDDGHAGGCG
ncbi:2-hydroxychromene-2-carboxylate isomerase [Dactylosporangium matsuzakiense]|uniref:2-hydroxychromene-2-carboxylate isomerase n=1 Tax=Dactylosporangium matsuzakiense TaxID=53360 RepID=A0A9W6KG72_9ACTN|nr:DsbA family protein [Dactylosporangium matsuzakiense]UWZ42469.1 DsbA family protein [Dactylosporangium matsuzakiense]GLL00618.1 hypothetical protein GCM10017581_023590 [Dactylosporangium matsuzakiense]